MNIQSVSAVHKHVETLVAKGALEKNRYRSRSIQGKEKNTSSQHGEEVHMLTLIGTLSASAQLRCHPGPQEIAVPKFFVFEPNSTYVFRVKGDGFQEEGIQQGDLLLVEARPFADPGETVVAEVGKEKIFIRKFLTEEGVIRLTSQNPALSPHIFREIRGNDSRNCYRPHSIVLI